MLLKGALHVHTTCSDGKLSPQQVADAYGSLGFDFIAFTDHDYLLKPFYRDMYDEVKTDMLIFTGVELTVFLKGYIHVNRIEGDRELLHIFNHVGEYDLSPAQVMDRLAELERMYPIDAVEITSKGFREPLFENLEMPYPKIASDDSHATVNIGRAWIELDVKRDRDSIIRAVKNGDFWNCFI
jgi:hypothetical protein